MAGNTSTIQIEVRVDGKGGIKVLRQIGTESEKTGKKGQKGFRNMGRSVGAFNKQMNLTHGLVAKLGAAFGLWQLWRVSQGFLDVAVQTENYKLRLNALLGSVSEGNRMFQEMSKFAGEVPFTYDQIMASATQLSGVMRGGIEEIKSWMPLIADLAAVSGLDIQTATEQIIRMYSAGAASADLFRERGITAMLGFQAGVSYSAAETRKRLMEAWKDPESKFKDATKEMAKSWAGLVSMMGDKWFQFRHQVMEFGPFQIMKERLGDLLKEIDRLKKTGQLDLWAADMADGVLASIDLMMIGFQGLSKAVYGFRALFGRAAEAFYQNRAEALEKSIKYFERQIQPGFWSRFFATDTDPAAKAKIIETINELKAKREEALLSARAGEQMGIDNIASMDRYSQAIQKARDSLAKLRADMEARRGERPEADADLGITKKPKVTEPDAKALKEAIDLEAKLWEYEVRAATRADDEIVAAHEAMIEYGKTLDQEAAKNKISMTEKMYSDLKFTSDDYYAYQLNQLQRQSDGYEKFTGNTVLAHLWLTEQIKALDKERLEAANKNNQHLIDLSQRTADAIEDNFSSFYRDFWRGELDSAEDYFRKFCYSLTDSFSDMMGQMTKEALFGGGSSGGSGLLKSLFSGVGSLFGKGKDTENKSSLAIKVQSAALTDQSTIVEKLTSNYTNFEKGASGGMKDLADSTNVVKKITGVFANDRIISSQIYIPLLTTENTKLMQQQLIVSQLTAGYQRLYAIKQLTGEQQTGGAQTGGTQTQLDSPDAMNNPLTWYEKMVNAGKSAYEWLAKIGSSVWSGLKYLWSGVQNIFSTISAWISKIPVIGPALSKVGAFLGKIPGVGFALKWVGSFFGGSAAAGAAASAQAAMPIMVLHAGGRVGRDPAPTRNVPASVFANAPRLHEGWPGLQKDEFPSILKYDETVLPPGVKPVNNMQNLTISVPVTIEGQGDDRLASKLSYEMEETAKRVMREEMR